MRYLLRARHRERKWVHGGNAVTHTMIAAGVPLTFFGGPFGLAVLVPGVLLNLVFDTLDHRILHYPSQLTIRQQLEIGDDIDLRQRIVDAQARYDLRIERRHAGAGYLAPTCEDC